MRAAAKTIFNTKDTKESRRSRRYIVNRGPGPSAVHSLVLFVSFVVQGLAAQSVT